MTKARKITWVIILSVFWSAIGTFLIGPLLTGLTDWSLVQPILAAHAPLKVQIEPLKYPLVHDGQNWIRVNIQNEGLRTIQGINADYMLACQMNTTAKAELHKQSLIKGDSDYFEFAADVDPACSISTEPYFMQILKDKKGLCYFNSSGNLTSSVCLYCNLTVNLYQGFDKIASQTKLYPFNTGGLSMYAENKNNCRDISEAENASSLVEVNAVRIAVFDFCTGCLQGTIKDKEWCKENCKGVYDQ